MPLNVYDTDQRQALILWLRANDIELRNVPDDSDFHLTIAADGQRLLHHEAFVRDPDTGNALADADGHGRREERAVPCHVGPPAWLRIPGSIPG